MNDWIERKLSDEQKNKIKEESKRTGTSYDDYLKAIEELVVWGDTNTLVLDVAVEEASDVIIAQFNEQPEF